MIHIIKTEGKYTMEEFMYNFSTERVSLTIKEEQKENLNVKPKYTFRRNEMQILRYEKPTQFSFIILTSIILYFSRLGFTWAFASVFALYIF
jgi:ABC-type multidrug transport system permease subunit